MATTSVSKIFNIEKIKSDGISVIDTLKEVKIQMSEVNKIKVDPFASAVANSNSVRQLEANLAKYIENLSKLKVGVLDVVKAQEIESRTALNNAKAKSEEAKARNLNAQAANNEAKTIAGSNKQAKEAEKQLKEYIKSVKEGQKELERLTKERQKLLDREAKRTQNEAEKKRLRDEANALKESVRQQREMQRQADATAKELAKQQAEADKLTNAYYRLDKEHQKLLKEAQRLGAELGVESKEFKDAAKAANELGGRLLTIDTALGRHQRNVGNYSSAFNGLGNSINQITREFPAFSNSLQTGFLAISNNLPIFFDEIQRINTELKEFKLAQEAAAVAAGVQAKESALLAGETDEVASALGEMAEEQARASAEGVKGKGVLKQLGAAVFSWQTLLSVGVTLLTVYGAKLIEWIFQQTKAEKIAEERAQTEKELLEIGNQAYSAAGRQIARVTMLTNTVNNNNLSLKRRKQALKELMDDYPSYLSNLTEEDALNGKLAATINNKVIPAIIAAARVRANEDKISKLAAKAAETQNKIQEERAKLAQIDPTRGYGGLIDRYSKENKEATNANKQINQATAKKLDEDQALQQTMIKGLANSIQEGEQELARTMAMMDEILGKNRSILFDAGNIDPDSLTEGKATKDRISRVTDVTNAEIKANDDILKSNFELLKAEQENYMAQQKFIFDNDKETLQERLNAFVRYNTAKEIIISEEAKMEIEATKNRLTEIAKIEAIAVDKRTPQQTKLLEFKAAFTRQLVVLQKKESLDLQTNIIETQQGITDFIEKEVSLQTKEFQNGWDSQKSIINQRRNEELKLLADSNKTARQQKIERRQIEARYNREIYDAQVDYVQQNLQNLDGIINDPNVSDSVRNAAIELRKILDEELGKVKTPAGDGTDSVKQSILRGLGLDKPSRDDLIRTITDAIKNLYETIFQALDQAREAKYKGILTELDAERDAINRNADLAKAANQSSLKSDEEKAKEEARIETNRLNKEAELDAKRKMTLRQQAQAEKRDAIFKIELQGAIATARALAGAAENPGLAIAAAALIQAYTQTQMALAQSRPIPEYAQGTMGHIGGKFIAGDGGEHEIIAPPNKAPYISSDKPTLYNEAKGTIVAPFSKLNFPAIGMENAAKAYERLGGGNHFMGMAIAQFLAENETKASGRIVKAIKKQKQPVTNFDKNGFTSYLASSNGTSKSLNRKRGIR